MKKFYSIFLGAVFSLLAVSCFPETEQDNWTPGATDDAFCYGVYFPVQEASGAHTYDPEMDRSVTITVSRANTSGAITVPFTTTVSADGVFQFGTIAFVDGQQETTLTVRFDEAEVGTTYSFSVQLDDSFVAHYGTGAIAFDFSVLIVSWVTFNNPVTGEPAAITINEGWWNEVHMGKLMYYEVNGVRTCILSSTEEGNGIWGDAVDATLQFTWYTKDNNAEGNNFLEVPKQYFGFDYDDWASKPVGEATSPIYVYDYYWYHIERATSGIDQFTWMDFAKKYGNPDGDYPIGYYDGNGGFYFTLRYYIPGLGGFSSDPYEFVALADGFTRVDYSLEVAQAGVPNAGKVPVSFTLGADVAKVVYDFKEGELSNINTERAISELKADSENAVTATGVYAFELEKTGVYTLVAAAVDAEGKIQNSASTLITYTAAADAEEKATVISGGISSAEKYVPQGVNPDTSLEVYIYGTDIVDAKFAVFSMLDIVGDAAGCQAALLASKSVKAEVIDLINGDGYVDVVTGLLPGTEYYLMVYASNGYTETVELYGSATTSGDPLPIYQTFTIDSYDATYELENAAAWLGTWNYYAVDYYGATGLREYLGKVNITASETPTEGPDSDGYYDEYVVVDGLFPNAVVDGPAYGYETGNCKVEMDVYAGAMYAFAATTLDGVCTIHTYAKAAGGFYNGVTYYAAFIPVLDGYYAMVDVAGSQYDFCGLRVIQTYVWDAFYDMLLIDPAKDDLAPSSVKVAVDNARKLYKESAAEFDNAVMSPKGRVSAIAESYKEKMNSVRAYNTVAGVKGERPVKSATVKSVTYRGVSTSRSISNEETRL